MKKHLLLYLGLLCALQPVRAVDLQGMVRDTQRSTMSGERFTLVWWIPQLYWEQVFANSSALSPDGKRQALELLSDYVLVAIVDAEVGAMADFRNKPLEQVSSALSVELQGTPVEMIAEEQLPDAMKNLLQGMRPVLQNGLGAIGKAMHMFVYPAGKERGQWENRQGSLVIRYGEQEMKWRLPLPFTLADRIDPKSGERFPGDYRFNPYTGERLP